MTPEHVYPSTVTELPTSAGVNVSEGSEREENEEELGLPVGGGDFGCGVATSATVARACSGVSPSLRMVKGRRDRSA
jgi:hypothetical protein